MAEQQPRQGPVKSFISLVIPRLLSINKQAQNAPNSIAWAVLQYQSSLQHHLWVLG